MNQNEIGALNWKWRWKWNWILTLGSLEPLPIPFLFLKRKWKWNWTSNELEASLRLSAISSQSYVWLGHCRHRCFTESSGSTLVLVPRSIVDFFYFREYPSSPPTITAGNKHHPCGHHPAYRLMRTLS